MTIIYTEEFYTKLEELCHNCKGDIDPDKLIDIIDSETGIELVIKEKYNDMECEKDRLEGLCDDIGEERDGLIDDVEELKNTIEELEKIIKELKK